ncbi:MAG TPA: hypothetical protein PLY70_18615 [Saprospiraceae bacterium]|nr:hypothetical protein [Saprospiraceae bacterium]
MWHKIIILGVVVCFFALLQSCSFDQIAQDVVPDDDGMGMDTSSVDTSNMMSNCNPDTVYFEKDILPILLTNCSLGGCHTAASRQNGVVTENYNRLVQTVGIKPFEPEKSRLFLSITSKNNIMPPSGRMSEDKINLISKWISQGATNLTCNP